ncbi:hypothetical protein ACRBEV_09950 [Methylobacterium phyllosphaerae]
MSDVPDTIMEVVAAPRDASAILTHRHETARPRLDVRPRVLAVLTFELSTATEIAERAGLPGWERAMHAARALARLGIDGLAIGETRQNRMR